MYHICVLCSLSLLAFHRCKWPLLASTPYYKATSTGGRSSQAKNRTRIEVFSPESVEEDGGGVNTELFVLRRNAFFVRLLYVAYNNHRMYANHSFHTAFLDQIIESVLLYSSPCRTERKSSRRSGSSRSKIKQHLSMYNDYCIMLISVLLRAARIIYVEYSV